MVNSLLKIIRLIIHPLIFTFGFNQCLFFLTVSFIGQAQITSFPWTEEFESSGLPLGWTQEYVNASVHVHVCACACVYVCMYACMHACIHTYTYTDTHTYTYTYTHTYTYTYTYNYTYTYT